MTIWVRIEQRTAIAAIDDRHLLYKRDFSNMISFKLLALLLLSFCR